MPFKVLLTARARQDLDGARSFLASSSPMSAQQWYESFLGALQRLQQNPERRSVAPESVEFPFEIREFFFRTKSRWANRALFIIVGEEVRILAIRRPGQPLITERDLRPHTA